MKLSDLKPSDQVLAEDLQDPEFRAEWERTAVARDLAIRVIQFRTERELTQRALARLLGMSQPQVARIEAGEHNPDIATLARLADVFGAEFQINIRPNHLGVSLVTKRAPRRRPTPHKPVHDPLESLDAPERRRAVR